MSEKAKLLKEPNLIQREQLVTLGDLATFKEELLYEITKLFKNEPAQQNKKWLKSSEVRKLLNISPGTLQNLRVNGTLPCTKIGGVMYYTADDLERMMAGEDSNHSAGEKGK